MDAHRFDEHLVKGLGYQTPRLLMDRVRAALAQEGRKAVVFDNGMDLGCGTGLSGEALRPVVTGKSP